MLDISFIRKFRCGKKEKPNFNGTMWKIQSNFWRIKLNHESIFGTVKIKLWKQITWIWINVKWIKKKWKRIIVKLKRKRNWLRNFIISNKNIIIIIINIL